jgi:phospholipid/cholesterol/gamma-HCH transport system ATP-binding protein
MDIAPIITVQNLTAKYGTRIILKNINFEVYPGEIFMIIGGSGCGKTTLLNQMIGLYEPATGSILIENQPIDASLNKIGVLYQSSALFGSMTLLQNVSLPLEELTSLPPEAINIIANNKLKLVGLQDYGAYMPAQISGGMQKRAALARAMALNPKILFLDEPTSGLDPITTAELDKLIVNLSQTLKVTFVIVSHDLSSICKIAQRIIMLEQKQIIAQGRPDELKYHANILVKNFFGVNTHE